MVAVYIQRHRVLHAAYISVLMNSNVTVNISNPAEEVVDTGLNFSATPSEKTLTDVPFMVS